MNHRQPSQESRMWVNMSTEMQKSLKLVWALFTHNRVPIFLKIIPVLSFLYWLNPIDPLPPPFNFLPFDDVAAVLLGLKLFVELSPQDLVDRLRYQITYGEPMDDGEFIDTTYQILDDD